ncbi:hypothetical protein [Microbaculum marinum]|uniref:Uncharacterized protein n=1 Tax=Microbaculum marinum TaxID=1764581 RepID=A0AAW9S1N3_9HYPH
MRDEAGTRGWGIGRRRIALWALAVAAILAVPLVATQVSDDWRWGPFDFVFAAVLLFGAAITYEALAGVGGTGAYRVAVALSVATALLLVWLNAAVGIIADDGLFAVMYLGVLAIGVIGALVARLRPPGMARACLAMAIAQLLVPAVVAALPALRPALTEPPGVVGVFALNTVFVALWLLSAWLFRRSAPRHAPADRS